MQLKRKLAIVAVAAAFASVAGVGTASATFTDMSGTVYDDGWSHYSKQRCVSAFIGAARFKMSSYPDGDSMRHKPTSGSGGGGRVYSDTYFTSGDYTAKTMGPSMGECFYWNSRQYEGTFETDWQDTWFGKIEY
ncbi:hypothetical protein [Streptomyces sp. KR80]|uniref:hypothetical protein n=1 Tax=Streptomyces sp. KR80 TaxID=3457426 RepID=UPI003FD04689